MKFSTKLCHYFFPYSSLSDPFFLPYGSENFRCLSFRWFRLSNTNVTLCLCVNNTEYYGVKGGTGINIQSGAATHIPCRKSLLHVHTCIHTYIRIYTHTYVRMYTHKKPLLLFVSKPAASTDSNSHSAITQQYHIRLSYSGTRERSSLPLTRVLYGKATQHIGCLRKGP